MRLGCRAPGGAKSGPNVARCLSSMLWRVEASTEARGRRGRGQSPTLLRGWSRARETSMTGAGDDCPGSQLVQGLKLRGEGLGGGTGRPPSGGWMGRWKMKTSGQGRPPFGGGGG